jgi:hypothetical protein
MHSLRLGNGWYRAAPGGVVHAALTSGGEQDISLGASSILAIGADEEEGGPSALFIAVCRSNAAVLVTLKDADADGFCDDLAGELSLPAGYFPFEIAARNHTHEVFLLGEGHPTGFRVLRAVDTNSDLSPDSVADYVTSSNSNLIASPRVLSLMPGGVLMIAPGAMGSEETPVTVVTDADGDGLPESITSTSTLRFDSPQPEFVVPVCSGATSALVRGTPDKTIELWKTDSEGVKTSEDPVLGRVGSVAITAESGLATMTFAPSIQSGWHTLFEVGRSGHGQVSNVASGCVHATAVEPGFVSSSQAASVVITGTGFDAATHVFGRAQFHPDLAAMEFVITARTATQLTVSIPALGASWGGPLQLIVKSDNGGEDGMQVITVKTPP